MLTDVSLVSLLIFIVFVLILLMYVRRPCLLSVLSLFNLFIDSFFHTQSMLLGEIFIVMTASLINSVVMFLLVLYFLILNLVFLEMRESATPSRFSVYVV